MSSAAILGVFLLALGAASAGAQPRDANRAAETILERFRLFTDCAPLILTVEPVDGRETFYTQVMASAESRLRAARVFIEIDSGLEIDAPGLYVRINRVGLDDRVPFSVEIHMQKLLIDEATTLTSYAVTWNRIWTGRGDDDYILNRLSQGLDLFLAAYLRVNAEACE